MSWLDTVVPMFGAEDDAQRLHEGQQPGVDQGDDHDDRHRRRVEHRGGDRTGERAGQAVGGEAREEQAHAVAGHEPHPLGQARDAVEEERQPGDEAEGDPEPVHERRSTHGSARGRAECACRLAYELRRGRHGTQRSCGSVTAA
jgi:hypothetical protein